MPFSRFDDDSDPFAISPPAGRDLGRLVTSKVIRPGWVCRYCPNLLSATASGGVICLNCDTARSATP